MGPVPEFDVTWMGTIGGGSQIKGQASAPNKKITLPIKGRSETVSRIAPQTDILSGLNTAIAVRHIKDPATLTDWL